MVTYKTFNIAAAAVCMNDLAEWVVNVFFVLWFETICFSVKLFKFAY